MRPLALLIAVLALAACGTTIARAEQAAVDSAVVTPNPPAAAATPAAPAAPVISRRSPGASQLRAELDAVLKAERAMLQRLEAEVRRAAGTDTRLALQRQISQLKQNTEIELLRVQARHARREGRVEVAIQIEAAVRELLMTPEERAAAELERAAAASTTPRGE